MRAREDLLPVGAARHAHQPESADEYFNAVSHEFNDAESKSDRRSWLFHALGMKTAVP